jgi:5'-3' exonuclease
MKALIDGDILLYRVGFTTQEETESIAKVRMDELVSRILDAVSATEYVVYLSCGRNDSFRAKLNPEYKANRTQPKPKHYTFLKDHLLINWNATQAIGVEADDLISIAQTKDPDNTVGCTIDKDILYQVIGHKYNFVKEEFLYGQEDECLNYFYNQMLVGDTADNLRGVDGIGKVKASKYLSDLYTEEELFKTVYDLYEDHERFWMNADCFWMLREEGQWFSKRQQAGKLRTLVEFDMAN